MGLKLSGQFELRELERATQKVVASTQKAAVERLKQMAIQTDEVAKKLIQKPSQGRVYTRGTIRHVASKPGEAPNIDTGRLLSSISFEVDPQTLTSIIGTNVKYGRYLEFGTKTIAARPWLSTAFKTIKRRFKGKDLKVDFPRE